MNKTKQKQLKRISEFENASVLVSFPPKEHITYVSLILVRYTSSIRFGSILSLFSCWYMIQIDENYHSYKKFAN